MITPIRASRNLAGMLVLALRLVGNSRAWPADRSMPARKCPGQTRRRSNSSRPRSGPSWRRCWQCHGPDKQKASLRLDSREALLKGGETGPRS